MIVAAAPALKQLEKAQELKSLSLAGMGLTQLPLDITKLDQLERLDLSNNQFRKLPEEITQLRNLKVLRLAGNPGLNLAETLLTLTSLPKLQKLDLADCRLRELPAELLHLPMLNSLVLDGNPLDVFSKSMLRCLPERLEGLSVRGCNMLSQIPMALSGFKSLKMIKVKLCSFEWVERLYLINPEAEVYVEGR